MMRLFLLLVLFMACKPAAKLSATRDPNIIHRSQWGAADAKPYKTHQPVRITVHHEDSVLNSKGLIIYFCCFKAAMSEPV